MIQQIAWEMPHFYTSNPRRQGHSALWTFANWHGPSPNSNSELRKKYTNLAKYSKNAYKAFSKLAHIENGPSNEEEKDEEEKNSFGRLSPVLARNHWPKKWL
jgi:hypothetical protein